MEASLKPMKVHLGCGDKLWPGFLNIDFKNSDFDCDIRKLNLPDSSAQEIHLIHVFEHLHRMEAESSLKDWLRVLKPGGKLVMEMPCLNKVSSMIHQGEKSLSMTLFALYGDVRLNRPEMLHKWCWSKEEITGVLKSNGFEKVTEEEPFFHFPNRDMRVIAFKPA